MFRIKILFDIDLRLRKITKLSLIIVAIMKNEDSLTDVLVISGYKYLKQSKCINYLLNPSPTTFTHNCNLT